MRKIQFSVVILFMILWSGSMAAQCLKGNCSTGLGVLKLSSGSIYEGNFAKGKFHGKGAMKFANNDHYVGTFYLGKKQGEGRYTFVSGDVYTGSFDLDMKSGKGKMVYANGDSYMGSWSKDQPSGQGTYQFKDGSVYTGQFAQGKFNGKGVLKDASGKSMSGTWKNNNLLEQSDDIAANTPPATEKPKTKPPTKVQKENPVVNTTPKEEATTVSTNTQKPSVEKPLPLALPDCTNKNCHQIKGIYRYSDGAVYKGDFVNGKPEGQGHCVYFNGDEYEGGWAEHSPHGKGTFTFSNKNKVTGIWNYGKLKERIYEDQAVEEIAEVKHKNSNISENNPTEIFAVVVGIATYTHMQSLKYTDDDAYQLYAFLKSPEGGALPDDHITILIDDAATKKNIASSMGKIFSKADANDVIMLYLSGHGLEGSFVPYDFDGTNNLLKYDDILEILDVSVAKHKVCITDACHSGSMYAARSPYLSGLQEFYEKFRESKGGSAFITSSKSEEVSLEYSGLRQGIFSHYLIKGLKGEANVNKDNIITLDEIYEYIYTNVRTYTAEKQTPSIGGRYDGTMPIGFIRNF